MKNDSDAIKVKVPDGYYEIPIESFNFLKDSLSDMGVFNYEFTDYGKMVRVYIDDDLRKIMRKIKINGTTAEWNPFDPR